MLVMISMIIFALVHNFCTASPIDQNGGDDASDYLCAPTPIDPIISHPSPQIPPRAVPPSTHTEVQDILDRILDIVFNLLYIQGLLLMMMKTKMMVIGMFSGR